MFKFYLRLAAVCAALPFVAMLGSNPAKAATQYLWDVNFSISNQGSGNSTPANITFTGNIVTTCDVCILNIFDVVSYQFSFSGAGDNGTISSSPNSFGSPLFGIAPTSSPPNQSPLFAVGSEIVFDPGLVVSPGIAVFANVGSPAFPNSLALFFISSAGDGCNCGDISLQGPGASGQNFETALGNSPLLYPNLEDIADFECSTDDNGAPDCAKLPPPRSKEHVVNEAILGVNGIFVSGTPLPAALPLFATGLGALGLIGWRRKRKVVANVA